MRDLQHWKDKVELSLDGRQVFFLFFGGATLACMLFALGVMTGRRLEARAIALEAPATEDPLAALDQLGDLEDEELTYHKALTKDARVGKKDAKAAAKKDAPKPVQAPTAAAPKGVPPAAIVEEDKPVVAEVVPPRPADAPSALPRLPEAQKAAELPRPPKVAAGKPTDQKTPDKVAAARPDAGAAHFTLQLSAFSARKDADDFSHRVQAAGYKPFVVTSDVPGKGVLYRVRVGDYPSKDAAIAEKSAVESRLKVSAYLAKL